MDPIIEMLRDENNAIEQLTARREELKRKLEEHRSGNISAEEFEKLSAERKDIEKELALRTKRRDELTAAADKNKNQGEGRGIMNDNLLHFKDGIDVPDNLPDYDADEVANGVMNGDYSLPEYTSSGGGSSYTDNTYADQYNVTVNVTSPGATAEEIAAAVGREIATLAQSRR